MKITGLYLHEVFDAVEWAAQIEPHRTKWLQGRVLYQVAEYKGFSVTVADSLAACADELTKRIGINSDVGIVNLEPVYFLEGFVLVDVSVSDSD